MVKIITILISLILLLNACNMDSKSLDPEQRQRMKQVRERIKEVLGNQYDEPVPQGTEQQLKRGGELYTQLCVSCHGGRGDGHGYLAKGLITRPSNFTDLKQATFYSEQARLYIIRKGVPGTPMMGWENILNENDILAVYLYVRSLVPSK